MADAVPRDVDATPVAWREAGAGPAVVFLHGLGMTRTGFDPQLAALAARLPLRGLGPAGLRRLPAAGRRRSPSRPWPTPWPAARRARAPAGAPRRALPRRHGRAARGAAPTRGRVRSLALLDTSPAFGLDGTRPRRVAARAPGAARRGREPDDVRRARAALDHGARRRRRGVAAGAASMRRVPDRRPAGGRGVPADARRPRRGSAASHAPTLVVVGEHDEETPPAYAQALADGIPGARLAIVPGAGHIVEPRGPRRRSNALLREHLDAPSAPPPHDRVALARGRSPRSSRPAR